MAKQVEQLKGTEKEFLEVFKKLCYSRNSWEVWADLMTVIACSLSNAVDKTKEHFEKREEEYEQCIKRLGSTEDAATAFSIIMLALESNPEQDFLGEMYMKLNLGNHWKGQFFTPYHICKFMADVTESEKEINQKGYISICDPCVGGGAMLIAAANSMRKRGINYQNHAVFVGQDIDRVTALMAYIQLSLLGCPGYVFVGNSLTNPATGPVLFPRENEGQELWITPMFFTNVWETRRTIQILKFNNNGGTVTTEKTVKKEHFYIFFNYSTEEDIVMSDKEKKEFISGKEKLEFEEQQMLDSTDNKYKDAVKEQFDMIFSQLIKKCEEDSDFNNKVLLEHKSFFRCMKYAASKAMEMRNPTEEEKTAARNGTPIVTPVTSNMLFLWIDEYYDLNDKDEVEKEKKKEKNKPQTVKTAKSVVPKKEDNTKHKKGSKNKNDMDGQMDLFSMMGI